MSRPQVHLICNAHLDPVWQWRWEEGCAEALSTFSCAVDLLHEHDQFIFNHNESVLYRWVQRYDRGLFEQIRKLVEAGRWSISGGWYLQPDANLPGLESFVRHMSEGRRYFFDQFGVRPKVAYNFDSFGHHAGMPQLLRQAGFEMYVHMRPQGHDLELPSDFYRWRGVDGSEILALRIAIGLYHTERDNLEQRLREGTEMALRLNRDVPVFWGLGNHGGGATRKDLAIIDDTISKESRVEFVHSTPDMLLDRLRQHADSAPLVSGDLQRVFTGCYTSLSRLKRLARTSLANVVQCEALTATAWWHQLLDYPAEALDQVWRDHLFNDFHDILPGTCTEPAERDALDLYGRVSQTGRELKLGAAIALNNHDQQPDLPITIANANPHLTRVPVEIEFMVDHRPLWTGQWHTRLFSQNDVEITAQQEQPDARLPFNDWRRKLVALCDLPGIGVTNVQVKHFEGAASYNAQPSAIPHSLNQSTGLIDRLETSHGVNCLAGNLLEPIVVDDHGDSWGTDLSHYNENAESFRLEAKPRVTECGPVRTITESKFVYQSSDIVLHTIAYCDWPVLEFRYLVHWYEAHKRLKLFVPTAFKNSNPDCEVPGGIIQRPNDGDQHVHGRWLVMDDLEKAGNPAIGIVNSGQHGIDCRDGTISLSVLRSAAYCHEQGQDLGELPATRLMDHGEHEFRLLAIAGEVNDVKGRLPGLADWLDAPPVVYSHLRPNRKYSDQSNSLAKAENDQSPSDSGLMHLTPATVRLVACKKAHESESLIVRLQESVGKSTVASFSIAGTPDKIEVSFAPFEIKTVRIERSGLAKVVNLIDEK